MLFVFRLLQDCYKIVMATTLHASVESALQEPHGQTMLTDHLVTIDQLQRLQPATAVALLRDALPFLSTEQLHLMCPTIRSMVISPTGLSRLANGFIQPKQLIELSSQGFISVEQHDENGSICADYEFADVEALLSLDECIFRAYFSPRFASIMLMGMLPRDLIQLDPTVCKAIFTTVGMEVLTSGHINISDIVSMKPAVARALMTPIGASLTSEGLLSGAILCSVRPSIAVEILSSKGHKLLHMTNNIDIRILDLFSWHSIFIHELIKLPGDIVNKLLSPIGTNVVIYGNINGEDLLSIDEDVLRLILKHKGRSMIHKGLITIEEIKTLDPTIATTLLNTEKGYQAVLAGHRFINALSNISTPDAMAFIDSPRVIKLISKVGWELVKRGLRPHHVDKLSRRVIKKLASPTGIDLLSSNLIDIDDICLLSADVACAIISQDGAEVLRSGNPTFNIKSFAHFGLQTTLELLAPTGRLLIKHRLVSIKKHETSSGWTLRWSSRKNVKNATVYVLMTGRATVNELLLLPSDSYVATLKNMCK